ncbi:MAG: hypothetical protein ACP5MD_17055, partial [Verrucomicrobiia bacterium]
MNMLIRFLTTSTSALAVLLTLSAETDQTRNAPIGDGTGAANPFVVARWIAPPPTPDPLVRLPLFRKEFAAH